MNSMQRHGTLILAASATALIGSGSPLSAAHSPTLLSDQTAFATTSTEDWSITDTAAAVGISKTTETWSGNAVDYNDDGLTDLWIGYHDWGGALFRNNGAGGMGRVSPTSWPRMVTKSIDRHGCAWGDVNGDGRLDQYCTVGRTSRNRVKTANFDNELWLATANGTFTDVATAWGVGDPYGRGRNAAFLDANADGWLDLYVTNEKARSTDVNAGARSENKLFLNVAGTGFARASGFGLDLKFGNGECVLPTDLDKDGWTDLVVCGSDRLHLFRNNGGSGFRDVSSSHGLSTSYLDVELADLDGDTDADIVGVQAGRATIQTNLGNGFFSSPRTVRSLVAGFRVAVGDADGDGRNDIYLLQSSLSGNPNDVLLLNRGGTWEAMAVPAMLGSGSDVVAVRLHPTEPDRFLVLNGREVTGPIHLLLLRNVSNPPTYTATESFERGSPGSVVTKANSWFQSGWENEAPAGSFTFNANWAADGSQSALVTADASTTIVRTHRFSSPHATLTVGAVVRWGLPLPQRVFAFERLTNSDGSRAQIALKPFPNGPRLVLLDGTDVVGTSQTTISASVSYHLEWSVDTHANTQQLRIFTGPDASTTPTETITGTFGGSPITALNVGALFPPGVQSMRMWMDALGHAPPSTSLASPG